MKVVAKNLPVEEIDNYTQMFHRMDKDRMDILKWRS